MIDSSIYRADLELTARNLTGVDRLRGKEILVTGGSGLVGEAVVDLLVFLKAEVCVAVRDIERARTKFGADVEYIEYDANKDIHIDKRYDFVIHAASNAHPIAMMKEPVETLTANVIGVHKLMEYARVSDVERVVFVSSSEVYGKKECDSPFREDMYGYVDLLNVRSCYPIGKRAAETLCNCYWQEYGVNTVIVRLGHIYGPTALRTDNRVASEFAYLAAQGKEIVMKSDGEQMRSYMYCLDCASAIITVMLKGIAGEAYNIASGDSEVSIREMAEAYAEAGNVQLRVITPSYKEKAAFNPMKNSGLDNSKLTALGWKKNFDAKTGFNHTVKILQWIVSSKYEGG